MNDHDPATCRNGDHYGQCGGATPITTPFETENFRCPDCGARYHWEHDARCPALVPVPGDRACPFCHGAGDCLECDPETAWK